MPKEEAYARGEALVKKKKYELGRQYLRFVAENYANDPIGKQAALRLADSFFDEKTPLGYLEAGVRYKDFRNRYPSHPKSDYALFRLAQCSDRQAERPDREQTNTRLAATAYRELVLDYPDSPYATRRALRLGAMRGLLAEHEYVVGHFYVKRRAWSAAKGRMDVILASYPDYAKLDKVLYEAGLLGEQARATRTKRGSSGSASRATSREPSREEGARAAGRGGLRPPGRGRLRQRPPPRSDVDASVSSGNLRRSSSPSRAARRPFGTPVSSRRSSCVTLSRALSAGILLAALPVLQAADEPRPALEQAPSAPSGSRLETVSGCRSPSRVRLRSASSPTSTAPGYLGEPGESFQRAIVSAEKEKNQSFFMQGDIIYIDIGQNDGVQAGWSSRSYGPSASSTAGAP